MRESFLPRPLTPALSPQAVASEARENDLAALISGEPGELPIPFHQQDPSHHGLAARGLKPLALLPVRAPEVAEA